MQPARLVGFVLMFVVCAAPLNAGFITSNGSGTYFYSDNGQLGDTRQGSSPSAFTLSGTTNGMTFDSTYASDYSVTKSETVTFESLIIQLSGSGPAGGIPLKFQAAANSVGLTNIDYSGLQLPGYDESFYVTVNIVLKGHLAVGDTLTYSIGASLTADVSGPFGILFDHNVGDTITAPGDFVIDLSVPRTYVTDLIALQLHGATRLQSVFSIVSTSITRGNDGSEVTTVNFDPGISNQAISNAAPVAAVPEPSTMFLTAMGILLLGVARKKGRSSPRG